MRIDEGSNQDRVAVVPMRSIRDSGEDRKIIDRETEAEEIAERWGEQQGRAG